MTNPIIEYWPNGNKFCEQYYLNGKLHNQYGPAIIYYYDNGEIERKSYWFNGKRHNPYNYAIIDYDDNVFEWWFNNKEYTNEVKEYLDKHNLIWQDMTQTDFDIMWAIIL